jgi:hypothetical protein
MQQAAQARGAAAAPLVLNLFPDVRLEALMDRVENTPSGYVWGGHLRGVDLSAVTLAVTGGAVAGSITRPGAAYAIRPSAGGIHVVQEINEQALPRELEPIPVPGPAAALGADQVIQADDGGIIDLVVVYTPAARVAQGGTAGIEALIDLGVAETNQAYGDSGAIQRIRLLRKQEIAYVESGAMSTDHTRLRATADGEMDDIHAIRDAYGADLVQLIEVSPDACGIAYLMTNVSTAFASSAFSVTQYTCVSPNYSFAHELGHNMGLRHDTYIDAAVTPFAYSHGYVNQAAFAAGAPANKRWRDLMAYNDQCSASGFNCTRLSFFSSPLNIFSEDAMGNATSADAVLSLDSTRTTVANFRQASVRKRGGQLTSQ